MLSLFRGLKETFELTYIFISHHLSVVELMCDRIAVMYLGRIVEVGSMAQVFANPQHPYTQSLPAAIPRINGRRVTETFWLKGEPPDASRLPPGWRFQGRCPHVRRFCQSEDPEFRSHGAQAAARHFAGAISPPVPT